MGLFNSKQIINSITNSINFASDNRSFFTPDGYKIYGKILNNYENLPEYLPYINGLRHCTEEDLPDFINNSNKITFINNKHLVKYLSYRCCDKCEEYTFDDFYHYNCWYDPEQSDNIYDYNICITCYDDNDNDKNESYMVGEDNLGIGNYFNWIPVYRDKEFNGLLYNCNPLSDNYTKYAVWICDEHNKIGINILEEDINQIKEELENYYIKWISEYSEDDFYELPLFNMVRNRELEYNF